MKLLNLKFGSYLSLATVLAACDPASIDPESIATGASGSGSSIGLFQLVADDYSEGTLTSADIGNSQVEGAGSAKGNGTASSPLEFTLTNMYNFTWSTSISKDSVLTFSMYSPDNPNLEATFAEINCSSASTSSCGVTQAMDCWFIGAQGGSDSYYTTFFCEHDGEFVETVSSLEHMGGTFQSDWSGLWADLDVDVGLKVRLCDADSTSNCDVATLGYLKLKEYEE